MSSPESLKCAVRASARSCLRLSISKSAFHRVSAAQILPPDVIPHGRGPYITKVRVEVIPPRDLDDDTAAGAAASTDGQEETKHSGGGGGITYHYTTDGSPPSLRSPQYDPAVGILITKIGCVRSLCGCLWSWSAAYTP